MTILLSHPRMPLGSPARPAAIFPKLRSAVELYGVCRLAPCRSRRSPPVRKMRTKVSERALLAPIQRIRDTIQSDLSRADFRVPVYFIENGARQGGASRSDGPPWLVTLERKRARQSESLCGTETREMDSEPRREKERSVIQRDRSWLNRNMGDAHICVGTW